ncbi:MAG: methyltransferase domain-containing protein [Nanoarchaeota archaeon]|nr:methyltransferase domain-containing protein [Nanoarchaeota archaeon]
MDKNQTIIKQYLRLIYTFWAKFYDNYVEPRWKFDRRKAIEFLQINTGDRILEIGVGTGLNLPFYPQDCTVIGIDISSAMLQKAKQKPHQAEITLQKIDGQHLPFPHNSFDKALATYALRVSPHPKKVLQELNRVVTKGGIFCIVDRFKGKSIISWLQNPFFFLIGGGWNYNINKLITGTSWTLVHDKPFGTKRNTRLIILRND